MVSFMNRGTPASSRRHARIAGNVTMAESNKKLFAAVEAYFADLPASGGADGRAHVLSGSRGLSARGGNYGQAQGALRSGIAGLGGRPSRDRPVHDETGSGGPPEAGAGSRVGVGQLKDIVDDTRVTAGSDQASRYWDRYLQVLGTSPRDFDLERDIGA